MICRQFRTQSWSQYLEKVTLSLNNDRTPSLHGLTPLKAHQNIEKYDPIIRQRRKLGRTPIHMQSSKEEQSHALKKYMRNPKTKGLRPGDYVAILSQAMNFGDKQSYDRIVSIFFVVKKCVFLLQSQ